MCTYAVAALVEDESQIGQVHGRPGILNAHNEKNQYAEQSITNFNGDGGEHSQAEKTSCRRPWSSEGPTRVAPKELVSSNASLTDAENK